jgi:hypothetical protein
MVACGYCSIVQRAGVVPMSIAGIAKEVTTITISAWLFDDELTPLNITGVAITVCGTSRLSVAGCGWVYVDFLFQVSGYSPIINTGNPSSRRFLSTLMAILLN